MRGRPDNCRRCSRPGSAGADDRAATSLRRIRAAPSALRGTANRPSVETACGACAESDRACSNSSYEVASPRLLPLDRLKQRFEVPFPEAARSVALDHFEEQCRTILNWLREDLQQVSFLVAIRQDAQPGEVLDRLIDLADARFQLLVIGGGHAEKFEASRSKIGNGLDDVAGGERDVLHAGSVVVIEVFLNL